MPSSTEDHERLSLIAAFERTDLPVATFTHDMHVRMAWCYLQQDPFPVALGRFATALRNFAAAKSLPGLYHETVTVAWMTLINHRLDGAEQLSWESFKAAFPELFAKPSLLTRYYSDDLLRSGRARRLFVMPDRVPDGPPR